MVRQSERKMKIAVCGVHGNGKSTCIDELSRDLDKDRVDVFVMNEVARDCPHPLGTIKAQRWIWHEHYSREIAGMASGCKVVLCDRTLMDNLVYLRHILNTSPSGYGEDTFSFLNAVTRVWMKTYDQIIRLPLNEERILNDVDDTLRPKDLVYAREIDKLFDEMVGDYVTHDENGASMTPETCSDCEECCFSWYDNKWHCGDSSDGMVLDNDIHISVNKDCQKLG